MAQSRISIGTIIDKSWSLYQTHFGELMSVSGWLLLAALIQVLGLTFFPSATTLLTDRPYTFGENIGTSLLLLNNFVVTPLLSVWVTATLVRLIDTLHDGRKVSLKTIIKESKAWFGPFLLVSVLYSLVLFSTLLFLTPGTFFLLIGRHLTGFGSAVSMIGTLLLIAGVVAMVAMALIWGVRYFFATYALLLENRRGRKALQRSGDLVKGNLGGVIVRLVIPKALFFLVFAFGLFVANTLATMIISGATGLNIDLHARLTTIVTGVLVMFQAVLITPIVLIADYVIYKDLSS